MEFAWHLREASNALDAYYPRAVDDGHVFCNQNVVDSDSGNGEYTDCGGTGDEADALQHSMITAFIAEESHGDTRGRGGGTARGIGLGFMNARETCELNTVSDHMNA